MDTAIYFSTDKLCVVQGKAGNGQAVIKNYKTVLLPEGTLINGIITNAEPLSKQLQALRRQKKIGRHLRIAVESSHILTKVVDMPALKHEEILAVVQREFQHLSTHEEELVFDYAVLENLCEGETYGRVLCCAMERQMLQSYDDLCHEAGLVLESCDIGINCMIKAAALLPYPKGTSLVLASVESHGIFCILLEDGKYLFSNRTSLLSQRGSEEWAAEIAGKLSGINQFYKSEKGDVALQQVYFYDLEEPLIEQCRPAVESLGIQVNTLTDLSVVNRQKAIKVVPFSPREYLPAIGCLMRK